MNYILLKGASLLEVKQTLQELANLYAESGFTDRIQLHQHKAVKDHFLVRFSLEPDFERFKYFVNFIAFPFEGEPLAEVLGYWTVSEQEKDTPQLKGKRLMLFLSLVDSEGDNVYAVDTANRNYKLGFASGDEYNLLPHSLRPFQEESLVLEEYLLLTKVSPEIPLEEHSPKKSAGCLPVVLVMVALLFLAIMY